MKIASNTTRILLIIVFILLFIIGLYGLIIFIGMSYFIKDLFSSTTSFLKMLWNWTPLILFTTYSIIAFIGLLKKRKYGWLFGFGIPIGFFDFLIIFLGNILLDPDAVFDLVDIVWLAISFLLPVFVVLGLNKIKGLFSELKPFDYSLIVALNLSICLSFISIFI